MSPHRGASAVPAERVVQDLLISSRLARVGGARGFALAMRTGAATIRELELENRRLRELLDAAEAKLGLRP